MKSGSSYFVALVVIGKKLWHSVDLSEHSDKQLGLICENKHIFLYLILGDLRQKLFQKNPVNTGAPQGCVLRSPWFAVKALLPNNECYLHKINVILHVPKLLFMCKVSGLREKVHCPGLFNTSR